MCNGSAGGGWDTAQGQHTHFKMLRAGADVAESQLLPAKHVQSKQQKPYQRTGIDNSPVALQKKQLFRESPESATPMTEFCSDTEENTFEGLGWPATKV
jgi:hypothetical protein